MGTLTGGDDDARPVQDPEAVLEQKLINEFLESRGHNRSTLHDLPEDERRHPLSRPRRLPRAAWRKSARAPITWTSTASRSQSSFQGLLAKTVTSVHSTRAGMSSPARIVSAMSSA